MNEALTLAADAPAWYKSAYVTITVIIGTCRIPMKVLSSLLKDTISEQIAIRVLRKENTDGLLSRFASPWYSFGRFVLDILFSVKLPSYTEVMEMINRKTQ